MTDAAAESPEPYLLRAGREPPPPLLLASPHSGRHYPASLLRQSRLVMRELRRGEDPYVDQLLSGMPELGVPTLAGNYARAFLDLNRDPAELDPEMFEPGLSAAQTRASERVALGLGVLPRAVAPGRALYDGPLPASEAAERVARIHTPYHRMLEQLLARARREHGFAVLIDCHSMPSVGDARAPHVVVGDLHGRAASGALVTAVEEGWRRCGYRVARNAPYAGAYTLERYGAPRMGVHAIQIEFDRALYVDQERLALRRGFTALQRAIERTTAELLAVLPKLDLGPQQRLAAE